MLIKSTKYGDFELPEILSQDNLERYYREMKALAPDNSLVGLTNPEIRGLACKAAYKMGWLKQEPDRSDAKRISWIGNQIVAYIASFEAVSPN